MTQFDSRALFELPLEVDGYDLVLLSKSVSSGFDRRTNVVRLHGRGVVGVGEDVNYDGEEQQAMHAAGAVLPLAGRFTLRSFSERLEELALFDAEPRTAASRDYRRWAFESAAADLACRQGGFSLAEVVEREPAPLSFAVSTRLEPAGSSARLEGLLERAPSLRFKLDPTTAWSDELIRALRELGRVDVVDLKGAYHGTPVDNPPDAALYERVALGLPEAWIEDPALTEETASVLAEHRARITWDAPIHSFADVEALAFAPRCLNCKPSRFGTWERLFEFYERCGERGIALYGGGQFELGPGRGQIQALASLFHPETSNDVAPPVFNDSELPSGELPGTPLEVIASELGFRAFDRPDAPWNQDAWS